MSNAYADWRHDEEQERANAASAKPTVQNWPHEYICRWCAQKRGGKWPSGHAATQHEGECGYCLNRRGLCSIGDWDWPDGVARGMRD